MFRKVLLHDILLLPSSPFLFSSIPHLLISYLLDNHIFITLLRCFFVHSISNLILHCLLDNDSSSSTRLSFLLVVFKWHPSLLYKRFLSSILLKFHSPDLFPIHPQLIFIFFPQNIWRLFYLCVIPQTYVHSTVSSHFHGHVLESILTSYTRGSQRQVKSP